jgi:hypothetical protein
MIILSANRCSWIPQPRMRVLRDLIGDGRL